MAKTWRRQKSRWDSDDYNYGKKVKFSDRKRTRKDFDTVEEPEPWDSEPPRRR
jgi:hypothetical protein